MPPKTKVSKEAILAEAIDIIRENGIEAINARSLASKLGTSTQPIFSNFATMDALLLEVLIKANELFEEFRKAEKESGKHPAYKASGMAYIRFAKEEKNLFALLYMRDRRSKKFPENLPEDEKLNHEMESAVRENTGLDPEAARLFHLEMWAFVHGIASMLATGFLELEFDLISRMLTDAYEGLKKQYKME